MIREEVRMRMHKAPALALDLLAYQQNTMRPI
jgi:hypothetical protein